MRREKVSEESRKLLFLIVVGIFSIVYDYLLVIAAGGTLNPSLYQSLP